MCGITIRNAATTQFLRFVLVGLANTLTSFVAYAALIALSTPYVAAVVLAYFAALAQGYTLNRRWTFKAGAAHLPGLAKYVTVQLTGLAVNLGLVIVLVEAVSTDRLLALALALPAVVVVTFAGNRYWTFTGQPH